MVIDEEEPHSQFERMNSQHSVESVNLPIHLNADYLGDPHRIRDDIEQLDDSIDRRQVLILSKLNDRGSNNTLKLDNVMNQVGRPVTAREYFLNGQPEPDRYDDDQTISENLIALRNVTRHNRSSLDNLAHKTAKDLRKIRDNYENKNSSSAINSSLNAAPKAEFEKLEKDVALALTKVSSLSKGNAFNTMDVESRVKTLEDQLKTTIRKLEATAKSVGVLKNGHGQSTSVNNQLPIGINRFDERLLKLEEQAFGQHSRNLFATTLETTVDSLSKDVNDLRKDLKLDLASSEMNEWLNAKQKAFLDTPAFLDGVRNEIKNYLVNFQITPRNLPQDTRQKIVEVRPIV